MFDNDFNNILMHSPIKLLLTQESREFIQKLENFITKDSFKSTVSFINQSFPQSKILPPHIAILYSTLNALKDANWLQEESFRFVEKYILPSLKKINKDDIEEINNQKVNLFHLIWMFTFHLDCHKWYKILDSETLNKLKLFEIRRLKNESRRYGHVLAWYALHKFDQEKNHLEKSADVANLLTTIRNLYRNQNNKIISYTKKEQEQLKQLILDCVSRLDNPRIFWKENIGFFCYTGILMSSPDIIQKAIDISEIYWPEKRDKFIDDLQGSNIARLFARTVYFDEKFSEIAKKLNKLNANSDNLLCPLLKHTMESEDFFDDITQSSSRQIHYMLYHQNDLASKYQQFVRQKKFEPAFQLLHSEQLISIEVITSLFGDFIHSQSETALVGMLITESKKRKSLFFDIHCTLLSDLYLSNQALKEAFNRIDAQDFSQAYHNGLQIMIDKYINNYFIPIIERVAQWMYENHWDELEPRTYAMVYCPSNPHLANKYYSLAQKKIALDEAHNPHSYNHVTNQKKL